MVKKKFEVIPRAVGRSVGQRVQGQSRFCPSYAAAAAAAAAAVCPPPPLPLLHHASHDTHSGGAQRWVRKGGRGSDRGRALTDGRRAARREERSGRQTDRPTGPDAFLIDGPKNLCEGAPTSTSHSSERDGGIQTQTGAGGSWRGEQRIHHCGDGEDDGAVDLRGPTGDLENELTISITHEEGDAARNIIQRRKERTNERAPAPAPAPARLETERLLAGDVTTAGQKRAE